MDFIPPTKEEVSARFIEYQDIVFHRKGGFKAVYFGKRKHLMEALKLVYIPDADGVTDEEKKEIAAENVKRVVREIEILRECKTPHIVKLGSLSPVEATIHDQRFIAYSEEYLDGSDLSTLIRAGYHPDEAELRTLAVALLGAIKELWFSLKTVHRDIKPLNIMKIGDDNRKFVLVDLGIAYKIRDTALTRNPANVPGSLYYLAPEMLQPNFRETLDFKSDLYAAGLTIYEYATNVQPFARRADATGQTLTRILYDRPKPLKDLRSDLPEDFCETIDQLLKKLPALRPSNIDKLVEFMESHT